MSFSPPKNVPRFDDAQRDYENVYWSHTHNGGIRDKVGGLFQSKELPMYKDKPYNYPRSAKRPFWRRRRALASVSLTLMILLWTSFGGSQSNLEGPRFGWSLFQWHESSKFVWEKRTRTVRAAFETSWDGYVHYAWGKDEYHPIARTGLHDDQVGSIVVDSLETLIVMNLTSKLSQARDWAAGSVVFSRDTNVNSYETTSRVLGGLLSAHYLSTEFPELAPIAGDDAGEVGEDLYIEKATDLADRLLGAFDSPSGIAFPKVNLETRKGGFLDGNNRKTATVHAAGMQLEFRYMSVLLGEKLFWDAAEKSIQSLDFAADSNGLVAGLVSPESGQFAGLHEELSNLTVPYYEYLIKQYLQTSRQEPVYHEMWDEALSGIKHRATAYSDHARLTVLGEIPSDGTALLMDETACKLPGLIALAATEGRTLEKAKRSKSWNHQKDEDIAFAKELMKSCWALYKASPTGLAAAKSYIRVAQEPSPSSPGVYPSKEIEWNLVKNSGTEWKDDISLRPQWAHNEQDPSFVESLFYLWRISNDETYRQWGWEMFKSYQNHTSTPLKDGFVSLSSVADPPQQVDIMNPLWLSRTLKFFYLLFAPRDLLPLDKVVYTAGGHVLPRFKLTRGLKTGWQRKARNDHASTASEGKAQKPVSSGSKKEEAAE